MRLACCTLYTNQNTNESGLTVVVDGLGHPFLSLVQHPFVQIDNLHLDIPVPVLLPSLVQDLEGDISRPACYIQTLQRRGPVLPPGDRTWNRLIHVRVHRGGKAGDHGVDERFFP